MADVILRFEMRTMKLDGFAWCLKSDVDKLARHHQQQVIEGNRIREDQRYEISQLRAALEVMAGDKPMILSPEE